MSFAGKYNKSGKVFSVDTDGWDVYKSLADLFENDPLKIYPVRGFYINNKSKFGPRPTMISDGFFVNLPEHMLDDVRTIMTNPEDVATIDAGKVAFRVRTYTSKAYNKECFGVEFLDVE